MAKLNGMGHQLLSHPTYSPELTPSDHFFIPNLEKWLVYFENFGKYYYLEGKKRKNFAKVYLVQRRLRWKIQGFFVEKPGFIRKF